MTQPALAQTDFKTGERVYPSPKVGSKFPSVSTILGSTLPKQHALVPWASRVVAEVAAEVIAEIDEGVNEFENGDPLYEYRGDDDGFLIEEFADDLRKMPTHERDAAGELGDEVHDLADNMFRISRGNPEIAAELLKDWYLDKEHDETYRRMQGIVRFLKDHKVEVVDTEFTVFNDTVGYAGTCDLAAYIDGQPYFIDVKTSKDVYDETALQIVSYKYGEYVADGSGGTSVMPFADYSTTYGAILHVQPKKVRFIEVPVTEVEFKVFRALHFLKTNWVDRKGVKKVIYDSSRSDV